MPASFSGINQLRVLKAIRRLGPISRVELADATGLAGATITEITAALFRRRLVTEQRQAPNGKGRPRLLLQVNPKAAIVVGANTDHRGYLQASFVDLAGNRLHSAEVRLPEQRVVGERRISTYAADVAEALQAMIRAAPCRRRNIGHVALSLSGIIDSVHGIVHFMATFPDDATPVADIVSRQLHLPVTVENEVDGLARAEHWFGTRAARDDFSLVYVGLHIGMARYLDGRALDGRNGFNTEFGHVKTAFGPDARPCICGARGCLTCYGLPGNIVDSLPRQFEPDRPFTVDLQQRCVELIRGAADGDAAARSAIRETGTHLGIALANHINTSDPGHIVVLTEFPGLPALLESPLHESLQAHALHPQLRQTTIVIDTVNPDWRWQGAAALALEQSYAADPAPAPRARGTLKRHRTARQ